MHSGSLLNCASGLPATWPRSTPRWCMAEAQEDAEREVGRIGRKQPPTPLKGGG